MPKVTNAERSVAWRKIPENRTRVNQLSREKNLQRKLQVLAAYGNCCVLCGEADPDVLTVDHPNQDGAEHRRASKLTGGGQFYTWLITEGFPNTFRLLCANCNIKAFRQHQREQYAPKS